MNELALFAGGGGGLLGGIILGWRPICYVEQAPYAVKIIRARIRDGYLPDAPIWDDACTFDGRPWSGYVDIVTGGFPCQPFSNSGERLGEHDPRNLWPDTIRIIREVRPHWCLLENVAALVSNEYFGTIIGDLAASGFDIRWDCIPAAAVGAPHRRDRLWIVAHAECAEWGQSPREYRADRDNPGWQKAAGGFSACGADGQSGDVAHANIINDAGRPRQGKSNTKNRRRSANSSSAASPMADAIGPRLEIGQGIRENDGEKFAAPERSNTAATEWWAVEPGLDRVVNGMAHRVDRLKAIGNGQVPLVAATAWDNLSAGMCRCGL